MFPDQPDDQRPVPPTTSLPSPPMAGPPMAGPPMAGQPMPPSPPMSPPMPSPPMAGQPILPNPPASPPMAGQPFQSQPFQPQTPAGWSPANGLAPPAQPYATPGWNPAGPGYGAQPGPLYPGATYGWAAAPFGQPLTSWWQRVGATLLDWLMFGLPSLIIASVIIGVHTSTTVNSDNVKSFQIHSGVSPFIISLVVLVIGQALLMARSGAHNGQTLGKQATGYRVSRVNNQPVGFVLSFGRQAIQALSWIPLLGWI